jgi:hypothetical protein
MNDGIAFSAPTGSEALGNSTGSVLIPPHAILGEVPRTARARDCNGLWMSRVGSLEPSSYEALVSNRR